MPRTSSPPLTRPPHTDPQIDTIVISHTHLDHIGTVGYGGVWALVNKFGFTFDQLIDRDAGEWKDSNRDGKCDREKEINYRIIGKTSATTDKWLCWATSKEIKGKREIAKLCAANQIRPKDKGAKITVVGVDGLGCSTKDGKPVTANWSAVKNGPSENAYSVGLLIQYGDFSYLTMGDMDGSYFSGNTYNGMPRRAHHLALPRVHCPAHFPVSITPASDSPLPSRSGAWRWGNSAPRVHTSFPSTAVLPWEP